MKRFSFFVTVFLATRIFSNLIHYPYFRRLRPYFILCFCQFVPNSWSSRMSSKVKLVCVLFLRPTFEHQRIRPYFVGGSPFEQFLEFYDNIRKHNIIFFNYYRMSMKSFDKVMEILRPRMTKMDIISVEEK